MYIAFDVSSQRNNQTHFIIYSRVDTRAFLAYVSAMTIPMVQFTSFVENKHIHGQDMITKLYTQTKKKRPIFMVLYLSIQ